MFLSNYSRFTFHHIFTSLYYQLFHQTTSASKAFCTSLLSIILLTRTFFNTLNIPLSWFTASVISPIAFSNRPLILLLVLVQLHSVYFPNLSLNDPPTLFELLVYQFASVRLFQYFGSGPSLYRSHRSIPALARVNVSITGGGVTSLVIGSLRHLPICLLDDLTWAISFTTV